MSARLRTRSRADSDKILERLDDENTSIDLSDNPELLERLSLELCAHSASSGGSAEEVEYEKNMAEMRKVSLQVDDAFKELEVLR